MAIEPRTSALKLKKLPVEDLDRLTIWLGRLSRHELGPITADWLIAGCATGLRPVEWATAELVGHTLRVRNAKFSEEMGRGNGRYRHLDLSELSDREMRSVTRMVVAGRGWETEGVYVVMQRRCSGTLYDATCRLWPGKRKAYSLASCRHQAVSNLKETSGSREEISAVMGHSTTRAAQERYGRRRSAWAAGDLRVARPAPEEVATVRPGRLPIWERQAVPVAEIVEATSPTF